MPRYGNNHNTGFDAVAQHVDGNGNSWSIGANLDSVRGRNEISSLTIWPNRQGYPLTRMTLRDLPLDLLFKNVVAESAEDLSNYAEKRVELAPHPGRSHQDQELRFIAEIYDMAFKAHLPVQQTIAETLDIPISTAAKRIMAARKRGYITATKGKRSEPNE